MPGRSAVRHAVGLFLLLTALGSAAAAAARGATVPPTIVDRSTPQAAMRAMVDAIERGDEAAVAAGIRFEGDADGKVGAAIARELMAVRNYWHAMWKRWGRREAVDAYVKRGITLPDSYLEWPHAKWRIDGDRARVDRGADNKGPHGLTPLRREEGQWFFDIQRRPSEKQRVFTADSAIRRAEKYEQLRRDIEAGKFASVHDAIDVLSPRQPANQPEQLTKEQLDPKTIQGAMLSLGLAAQAEDPAEMAKYFHADGPAGAELVDAHVKRTMAVHRFILAISEHVRGTESLAVEFGLTDRRNDTFGHLLTEWKIEGDRATGTHQAGPAEATMRRVGGVWKIDLTPPAGSPPVEKLVEQLRHQTQVVAAVTADVREKRLFTVDEVRRELKRRGLTPATVPAAGEVDVGEE